MSETPDHFTVTRDVSAPPEEVWRCLTEADCLKAWWRENIEFEAKPGGRFCEPWRNPAGEERITLASVIAFHPPYGMVMVWADDDWTFDTIVSFTIEATERGSRIHVEHQGWSLAPETARFGLIDGHRAGWTTHLDNFASHAEDHAITTPLH